jgi:hypothetical protein
MKEWDLDSYNRKWRHTVGIFKTPDNVLHQGYFNEFFVLASSRAIGVLVSKGKDDMKRYSLESESDGYPTASIEYHPITSGWYPHTQGHALLVRKHGRGFLMGVSDSSYTIEIVNRKGHRVANTRSAVSGISLLRQVPTSSYERDKPFGILSRRLWWNRKFLMFLHRTIGIFSGDILQLESASYKPYVAPYLEDQCQIV